MPAPTHSAIHRLHRRALFAAGCILLVMILELVSRFGSAPPHSFIGLECDLFTLPAAIVIAYAVRSPARR
jgi:hypothetical protein